MNAIRYERYGPPAVLRLENVERPTPADDQVLLRIHAASVNPLDWHFMRGTPYLARIAMGFRKPKSPRLGADVAGVIEAVGRKVTRFKPGDAVFGICEGAFAEYVCAAESTIVTKPENVTFEQAASVPVAGYTALQALRDKGKIQPGQRALVNGAAGGVGTFAVRIAKSFGANVTGVCSTRNVEMVRSIGASAAIDYTREDFTKGSERYDVILDCIGNHSLSAMRRVLNPKGVYIMIGGPDNGWLGPLVRLLKLLVLARFVSQRFVMHLARPDQDDLTILRDLMAADAIVPVIDRRYGLAEVPEAIAYLEEGHARGKVVIAVVPARTERPLKGMAAVK